MSELLGVTLGPKGRNVVLQNKYGPPKIVNDGETVLKEVLFTAIAHILPFMFYILVQLPFKLRVEINTFCDASIFHYRSRLECMIWVHDISNATNYNSVFQMLVKFFLLTISLASRAREMNSPLMFCTVLSCLLMLVSASTVWLSLFEFDFMNHKGGKNNDVGHKKKSFLMIMDHY